jgi:hypothetical protein
VTLDFGNLTALEKFMSRVDTSGSCWLWTGGNDGQYGYGHVWLSDDRPTVKTHRLAWELAHGPIPPGMWVCHSCDTPACCRPSHLFLATNRGNIQDAMRKGRLGGKLHPLLRDEAIASIVAGRETQAMAARRLGVNPSTVSTWLRSRGIPTPRTPSRLASLT